MASRQNARHENQNVAERMRLVETPRVLDTFLTATGPEPRGLIAALPVRKICPLQETRAVIRWVLRKIQFSRVKTRRRKRLL